MTRLSANLTFFPNPLNPRKLNLPTSSMLSIAPGPVGSGETARYNKTIITNNSAINFIFLLLPLKRLLIFSVRLEKYPKKPISSNPRKNHFKLIASIFKCFANANVILEIFFSSVRSVLLQKK